MRRFAILEGGRVASITRAPSREFLLDMAGITDVLDVEDGPVPTIGAWYDGAGFAPANAPPMETGDARARATARINRECGEFRARFITDITGQETVYQYKSDECDAWDTMVANGDDPLVALDAFPLIAGEAFVRGITPTAMRDLIAMTRAAWRQMANHSDLRRQALHEALRQCTTDAEIAALFPIDWSAP